MTDRPIGWPDDWPPYPAMHEAIHATTAVVLAGAGSKVGVRCVFVLGDAGATWIASAPTPGGLFAAASVAAAGDYFNSRCGQSPDRSEDDRRQVMIHRERYRLETGRPMGDPYAVAKELFRSQAFYDASLILARELDTSGGLLGEQIEAIVKPPLGDLIPKQQSDASEGNDPAADCVTDLEADYAI